MKRCQKCGSLNMEQWNECFDCHENLPPASTCSVWVVSKVISQPFDTQGEAESFAATMKDGFTHKNDTLLVTQNEPVLASEGLPATACSACGDHHRLRDEDAGTEREFFRLCIPCFKQNDQGDQPKV